MGWEPLWTTQPASLKLPSHCGLVPGGHVGAVSTGATVSKSPEARTVRAESSSAPAIPGPWRCSQNVFPRGSVHRSSSHLPHSLAPFSGSCFGVSWDKCDFQLFTPVPKQRQPCRAGTELPAQPPPALPAPCQGSRAVFSMSYSI